MSRMGALMLLLASVTAVACRKTSRTEAIESIPPASAERAREPEPEAAPTPPALDMGPAASVEQEVRKQAVITLLAGELAADSLPEVATEPGVPLDDGLRDRLAPVGRGLGSLGLGSLPRGDATVGAPESSATIANADRVVAGMRAGFRNCYNRVLAGTPDAQGIVQMVLQIDAQGGVTAAKASSKARLPAALLSCVESRARAAQFDPPEGKTATLKFKLTLALQS